MHIYQSFAMGTTDRPNPSDPLHRALHERFDRLKVVAHAKRECLARVYCTRLGELGFNWVNGGPGISADDHPSRARDFLPLLVADIGEIQVTHLGRRITLREGDMLLMDPARSSRLESDGVVGLIIIQVPIEPRTLELANLKRLIGEHLSSTQKNVRFASRIIREVRRAAMEGVHEDCGDSLSDMVLNALLMGYARTGAPPVPRKVGLRREALTFIRKNLADPALNAASIAAALGVNTRYVQRLFCNIGTTPQHYILQQRLDAAAARLRRSHPDDVKITDIAYDLGFNDPSYFARAFKRRFKATPREYRDGIAKSEDRRGILALQHQRSMMTHVHGQ
jgi:AraC-like DNA-binding protein